MAYQIEWICLTETELKRKEKYIFDFHAEIYNAECSIVLSILIHSDFAKQCLLEMRQTKGIADGFLYWEVKLFMKFGVFFWIGCDLVEEICGVVHVISWWCDRGKRRGAAYKPV